MEPIAGIGARLTFAPAGVRVYPSTPQLAPPHGTSQLHTEGARSWPAADERGLACESRARISIVFGGMIVGPFPPAVTDRPLLNALTAAIA